jgi:hypothetical protein
MCLIAFAQKDRSQIPGIHLMRAHARNDDGWGIMFPENGHVRIVRDTTGHSAFRTAWKQTPLRTPIAAHFRFGTSGGRHVNMAHPFAVLKDEVGISLAVMHNGVLSCVAAEGELSDTAVLVRDVLCPQLEAKPDLVEIEGWRQAMGAILGDDNKLLFMRGDGRTFFVNGWQGKFDKGGVWYSNTYSIAPPASTTRFLSAWDNWQEEDLFSPASRGSAPVPRPYATEPLDELDERFFQIPDLDELSEAEIYNFVCSSSPEDITDAILDMRRGR